MPVISLQNRCKIIQFYLLNKTIFFIQKRLKINKSTIWKIIEKWKRNGTVENAKKPGRVRKSDKLTERTIIKTSRGNPFLNSTQIAREVSPFLKISSSLVRKILIRHGLRARISIKKPFITSLNVQKRKNWCRQMVGLGDGFWENVVFSDETIMELNPTRREYVRRPPGEGFNRKYISTFKKFGGKKVMFWGFIKFSGERDLIVVENKLDSGKYQTILRENLMENLFLGEIFQQDNAPCHVSVSTLNFLNENGFSILENWPPQSPDLNIIENVWSYLKRRVSKRNPKCLEELIRFSFQEFSKIPTVYIQKLYRSVPRRLQLAIKKKGFCTKY